MSYNNDLTFFTNEPNRTLLDRFNSVLTSHTQFFDALVGYFRTSGFHLLYPSLENVEKIRILVGLNVDNKTIDILNQSNEENEYLQDFSQKNLKEEYSKSLIDELNTSSDTLEVEEGINKFIEWLKNDKLEMKIYPKASIHSKIYIMRKNPDKIPDYFGSVITGSSNFSKSGLKDNLEFNVELKDSRDVKFALQKFEELWNDSIDISEKYIDTIKEKTWLKNDITPYDLYLKTLYEYFKDEINDDLLRDFSTYVPNNFIKLQYQNDAVLQAEKILNKYNGVFISDVVGLGKTYICALLAQKLEGKKLVICPPVLVDYWENTLRQFEVLAKVESLGKLDKILDNENLMNNVKYIFIDESHRFRNSNTESYNKLHQICYGKKVILISATPQNNYTTDIANQIYLFQDKRQSNIIPNNRNLEGFFQNLETSLKSINQDTPQYKKVVKKNSNSIRDNVLRHIMIRRTRYEISKYYKKDLIQQGIIFPKVENPNRIIYQFNLEIEKVFDETISVIHELTYARYKSLSYLRNPPRDLMSQIVSQKNISGFMKSILVKRLESSFYAFKKTLNRFIESHNKFLKMCYSGKVYISKKVDINDFISNDNDDELLALIEKEEVRSFEISDFNDNLILDLKNDIEKFNTLLKMWESINEDPKINKFLFELDKNDNLKNNKIIVFTESKETADYLFKKINKKFPNKVIEYNGQSSNSQREKIESNFNPNYNYSQRDDIQYLITTDVLAEGISLHRSNVIINYDLPWNPTKIMQRVGRINRVGTKYEKLYIYNFFPTTQSASHLTLEENIQRKLQSFHDTLGDDFKYLSESEELSFHQLYTRLNTSEFDNNDENTLLNMELEYLEIIRDIRDNDIEKYKTIQKLPLKSKSGKVSKIIYSDSTISFMKQQKIKKFYLSNNEGTKELLFEDAILYLKAESKEKSVKQDNNYYNQLEKNKNAFIESMIDKSESFTNKKKKSKNNEYILKLLKGLKNSNQFNDEDVILIRKYIDIVSKGIMPPSNSKKIAKKIKSISTREKNYLFFVFETIKNLIPKVYLNKNTNNNEDNKEIKPKIIISSFLIKGN